MQLFMQQYSIIIAKDTNNRSSQKSKGFLGVLMKSFAFQEFQKTKSFL